ncbi:ornithine cyclodeaminase family protein [Amycolatopsis sp. CA-230715]|uniref:ornithine cyclodeaminase family protein n=1 Tax=Amycolatopsis sp. CA-230715 TaxID=2745196 RepID=UPI001C032507|nr:ornithine cyclodeaminase family protein [Amycolatopsis sp. CA-230715]QWF79938.1 Alanine dehydrogenase [Amycolatopsis sp. CA-230715]
MTKVWMRYLSGADIDSLGITDADIVGAVEDVLADHGTGRVVFEPRTHLVPDNGGKGHFNVLRGHLSAKRVSGVKVVGDFVANFERGLPSEMALILLLDPETGMPRAIVDGTMITDARTGAMTAVGAKYLARRDAKVLGHVGARGTAWWNVVLLDSVFDFDEIRVTSKRPESRADFADRLSTRLGKPVLACETWEETLDGADILVEASRLTAPEPLLRKEFVRPGALLVPYGTISALELDLLDVVDKVVVDDWRESRSGNSAFGALRPQLDAGLLTEERVHAEIGDVVAGSKPGREDDRERVLFWHRGLSTTDLAVAHLILGRAEQAGVGTMLPYR